MVIGAALLTACGGDGMSGGGIESSSGSEASGSASEAPTTGGTAVTVPDGMSEGSSAGQWWVLGWLVGWVLVGGAGWWLLGMEEDAAAAMRDHLVNTGRLLVGQALRDELHPAEPGPDDVDRIWSAAVD